MVLNPDGRIKQLERRLEALALLCDIDLTELDRQLPAVYVARRRREEEASRGR